MSAREFLMNVTILSTIMAVAALIEAAVPMFAHTKWAPGRRAASLGLTAVVFLLNWVLSSAAGILALALSPQASIIPRWPALPSITPATSRRPTPTTAMY